MDMGNRASLLEDFNHQAKNENAPLRRNRNNAPF